MTFDKQSNQLKPRVLGNWMYECVCMHGTRSVKDLGTNPPCAGPLCTSLVESSCDSYHVHLSVKRAATIVAMTTYFVKWTRSIWKIRERSPTCHSAKLSITSSTVQLSFRTDKYYNKYNLFCPALSFPPWMHKNPQFVRVLHITGSVKMIVVHVVSSCITEQTMKNYRWFKLL